MPRKLRVKGRPATNVTDKEEEEEEDTEESQTQGAVLEFRVSPRAIKIPFALLAFLMFQNIWFFDAKAWMPTTAASTSVVQGNNKNTTKTMSTTGGDDNHDNNRMLFHYIHVNGNTSLPNQAGRACIESVFYHHPGAHVKVHVPVDKPIPLSTFANLIDLGYRITVETFSLRQSVAAFVASLPQESLSSTAAPDYTADLLSKAANQWLDKYDNVFSKQKCAAEDMADLMRLLIVHREGGIYLDFDFFVIKPLTEFSNVIGYQRPDRSRGDAINTAVLIFSKNNDFIKTAAVELLKEPKSNTDEFGINGPLLVTRVVRQDFAACETSATYHPQ